MLPPLPRCSRWAYLSLKNRPAVSAFPDSTFGSACTLTFSRIARRLLTLRPAHSRGHQFRDRYPGASDISSPSCLPRLLPAGAVAGRGLHPLDKRRLVTAHVGSCHSLSQHERRWCATPVACGRYSITVSASPSSVGGMVRLRSFAVLRLSAKSKRVGRSTGKSDGFSPLRIFPAYTPTLRNASRMSELLPMSPPACTNSRQG